MSATPSAGPDAGPGRGAAGGASAWISLYGPLLLALYFVATSRWGSFVLPGPPYIGDIALAALIAQRLWTLLRSGTPKPLLGRGMTTAVLLLLGYSAISLALGEHSETALRDAAPYFYAVLVLFGQSYRTIPAPTVDRLVFGALIFHAAWFSIAEFAPSLAEVSTPGDSETFIFGIRADIDGALLGVLMGLALDRVMTGRDQLAGALLSAWALTLILLTQSRASLLAALAVLAFMLARWIVVSRRAGPLAAPPEPAPGRRPSVAFNSALAAAVLLLVPAVLTVVSGTPEAFERSVNAGISATGKQDTEREKGGGGGGGLSQAEREKRREERERRRQERALVDTGVGTFKARVAGWEEVIGWVDDEPDRLALGAGFGPHYLQLSGADVAFFGPLADPSIRAVHNFGLNTWARLGVVGLLLVVAIAVMAAVAAVRLSFRSARPPLLDLLASLLVFAIPVVALLGVVLESPFGAIPYFWAVGYLAARMVEERLWRALPLPARLGGAEPPSG